MSGKPEARPRHRKGHSQGTNGKGRFDRDLIQAKNSDKTVELSLALEDPICDPGSEDLATVKILEVDTYAIRVQSVRSEREERESWISKSFIVSATIL